MARAARAELANMRAMEEQNFREEAHSRMSGGGRFIGAGATPSMGLSEFRGGLSLRDMLRRGAPPPKPPTYSFDMGLYGYDEFGNERHRSTPVFQPLTMPRQGPPPPPVKKAPQPPRAHNSDDAMYRNPPRSAVQPPRRIYTVARGGRRRRSKEYDEMEGGAAPVGSTYRLYTTPRTLVPYRGTNTPTAIVPYRPNIARGRAPPLELVPYVPRLPIRTPTTLVTRTPGVIRPYNPAEAQYRLNPPLPAGRAKITGSRASVLAGLAAAGIALGLGGTALAAFIAEQSNQGSSAGDPNYPPPPPPRIDEPPPPPPPVNPPPPPPGGTDRQPPPGVDDGTGYYPSDPTGSDMSQGDLAYYLQTGNLGDTAYSRNIRGSGKHDGRSVRAAIVRKVMQEHGCSMIEASKYVKAHNLY